MDTIDDHFKDSFATKERVVNISLRTLILISLLFSLLAGCSESKKNPAVDLESANKYWQLKHQFDNIVASRQAADKIWQERNTFLLAHTNEPAHWELQENLAYQEIEQRYEACVQTYDDLAWTYNSGIEDLPEELRHDFCYADEESLPGNIPSSIPHTILQYDHENAEPYRYYHHTYSGFL